MTFLLDANVCIQCLRYPNQIIVLLHIVAVDPLFSLGIFDNPKMVVIDQQLSWYYPKVAL